MTSHRPHRLLVAVLTLLLTPLLVAGPARAQRLGPGHVSMPGFSGYVTAAGGELGVGRLADGTVGVCLDTGPGLRWPAGTPPHRLVRGPRAAYLLTTYLPRARHDGRVAAALWWALGGTLGLNSHPAEVRSHVTGLRAEAPGVYAAVHGWQRRMMAAATREAPGPAGYATRLRLRRTGTTAALTGIGALSGTGHWVAGHRVRLAVTGARFADGRATWTGTSGAAGGALRLHTHPGTAVRVVETIGGLARPVFRLYDAGGSTQRVATSAGTRRVRATARLARPPHPTAPLRVVKTAEGGDPAGLVGVAVAVHVGSPHGPVVGRHTFSADDVSGGTASYTLGRYDATRRYVATITAEPAGWVPEAATVPATESGGVLVARLVDDRVWRPTLATRASAQRVRVGSTLGDSVSVADTGGDSLTGSWRLLGPVRPGGAGCAGRRWASAPVAAEGDFAVSGDGTYAVGTHRVTAAGCYTYVERLAGNRTTLAVPWTTPGATTETTLALATPRLATQASPQRGAVGSTLVDHVRVAGLGGARASGAWRLLGPIAPGRRLRCSGLDWTGAPVAARGSFRTDGDGTVVTGRFRVRRGGCYAYRERLRATPVSGAVPWTQPGTRSETVVVRPPQPRVPTHPTVPAGGGRPAPARLAVGSVALAATGLQARLSEVSFHGDALTPPGDIATAAVWHEGAALDDVVGTTVLVGHVSDYHDRPGAFHRLWGARRGQSVVTTATDGARVRWRITHVTMTAKRELPQSLFRQGLARRLVLVTCGNEIHYADGGFHYRSNLVVEAVPW